MMRINMIVIWNKMFETFLIARKWSKLGISRREEEDDLEVSYKVKIAVLFELVVGLTVGTSRMVTGVAVRVVIFS